MGPTNHAILVPLGNSKSLGSIDLLDLDLDPTNLQPPHPLAALGEDKDEISQALRYLNLSHRSPSNILVNQSAPALSNYEQYQPFLGWKPTEAIKKTLEATTQWATTPFNPPLK